MNEQLANYTLKYIEDEKVPLAASIEKVNNAPVFIMVGICLFVLVILAYSFWYTTHRRRIAMLDERYANESFFDFYFRPFELLRLEYETENSACGQIL